MNGYYSRMVDQPAGSTGQAEAGGGLEAVLFDLDGVLADSYQVWKALLREAAARFGGLPVSDEDFQAVWGQDPAADVERFLPAADQQALESFYARRFPLHVHRVRPMHGARRLLEYVRSRGLSSGVVTNAPRAAAGVTLRALGFDGLVDTLVGSDDVRRAKPSPQMVRLALERLSVGAASAVLVGDSRFDLQAGRAAGVLVIGLGQDADLRVESLDEIPALLVQRVGGNG
jgi:HAD superfamily hydrolase (TIGR01509 family)